MLSEYKCFHAAAVSKTDDGPSEYILNFWGFSRSIFFSIYSHQLARSWQQSLPILTFRSFSLCYAIISRSWCHACSSILKSHLGPFTLTFDYMNCEQIKSFLLIREQLWKFISVRYRAPWQTLRLPLFKLCVCLYNEVSNVSDHISFFILIKLWEYLLYQKISHITYSFIMKKNVIAGK